MEKADPESSDFPNNSNKPDSSKVILTPVTHDTSKGALFLLLLFLAMVLSIIVLAVSLTTCKQDPRCPAAATDPPRTPQLDDDDEGAKSKTNDYRFASVASDSELCSRIGTNIMARLGGSVVDAAISTLLCTGLINIHSMGIGGGFLMTIYDSEKKEVLTLNSREMAPLAASEDMFVNDSLSSTLGALAIAVPGEIAGYAALHERYGRVPWRSLFEPTIKLCEDGFAISKALEKALQRQENNIRQQPGLRELFVRADGTICREGDVVRLPKLARTLRTIAEEGASAFYNGSLADDIVQDIQDRGGILTKEDLRQYEAVWKKPVQIRLSNGGYTLYGPPPPSSSLILNYILSIMDGYNVSQEDVQTLTRRVLLTHRLIEAIKFGYGKRSLLGDEDFVNITELLTLLQKESYARETRAKIDDDRVFDVDDYQMSSADVADGGTSHLSVYGADGWAISATSTINTYFGSKVMGERTGILFNNEMDDFSSPGTVNAYGYTASPSNFISPSKRPMSSMSPTIVLDGDDRLVEVVGAAGGSRIITAIAQVLINTLWLGYDIRKALDEPRFHHQLIPNEIFHELSWPLDIQEGLKRKGHKVRADVDKFFSVVQVIRRRCPATSSEMAELPVLCLHGASDVRKGGAPDGY